MNFFLQQGSGMMEINRELVSKFKNIGVITAPRAMRRDANINRLPKHAKELKKLGAKILFDPEFYETRTNMEKILKYPYFDGVGFEIFETVDFNNKYAESFIENVLDYQITEMKVDKLIVPNRYVNSVDQNWYDLQDRFLNTLQNYDTDLEIYLTLALGPDVIKNKDVFDELIGICINYSVDGFYIVLKSPKNKFLIDDEEYLYSILDAFISLRIAGKDIILGYANQQSLIYAASGVETIASGNFRNVRSFDPENYIETQSEHRQRSTWYYDGNSLSEYRPQQLDLAYRRGLRDYFGPPSEYSTKLLNSEKPSNIPWGEGEAFRHYLVTLRNQWLSMESIAASKRIDYVTGLLENLEVHVNELEDKGFRLGTRAFTQEFIDASLSALIAIKSDRKYDILNL